jgi:hypothetical protein
VVCDAVAVDCVLVAPEAVLLALLVEVAATALLDVSATSGSFDEVDDELLAVAACDVAVAALTAKTPVSPTKVARLAAPATRRARRAGCGFLRRGDGFGGVEVMP